MVRKDDNRGRELTEEQRLARDFEVRREQFRQKQLADDRKALLKLPSFTRVMADVLTRGQCFGSVMTGNSQTYYLSGKQDYAREIFADLLKANQTIAIKLMLPETAFQGIEISEDKESDVG